VRQLIFSGNTTMLHLLFGLDVTSMGVYPYQAQRLDFHGFNRKISIVMISPQRSCAGSSAVSAFLASDLVEDLPSGHCRGFAGTLSLLIWEPMERCSD